MRGVPYRRLPGWNPNKGRIYDETEIRRLCAPREQGGDGLSLVEAAARIGCSDGTVHLALHPECRVGKDEVRRRTYRRWSVEELKKASDYHWQRLAVHQGFLDEIEAVLQERCRNG